jgi:hypothetical protein
MRLLGVCTRLPGRSGSKPEPKSAIIGSRGLARATTSACTIGKIHNAEAPNRAKGVIVWLH